MRTTILPGIKNRLIAAFVMGVVFFTVLSFAQPAHALSSSYSREEMMKIIQDLMAQITSLQAQLVAQQEVSSSSGGGQCVQFTHSMYMGVSDSTTAGEVTKLQNFLTKSGDYTYGEITGYFGPATQEAVQRWQAKNGVVSYGDPDTTGYGLVGKKTRAKMLGNCTSDTVTGEKGEHDSLFNITSPKQGESFDPGDQVVIEWEMENIATLSIALYQNNKWVHWIAKDMDAKDFIGDARYKWTIPENIEDIVDGGENLKIYITARFENGIGYRDDKSGQFSIVGLDESIDEEEVAMEADEIVVTSPNGGEEWRLGGIHTITWKPYQYDPDINPSSDVTAYLEEKVLGKFVTVGKILENGKASIHTHLEIDKGGNYAEPGEYYVKVVNNKTGAWDRSDRPFTILKSVLDEDITVTSPNGGETWRTGETNTITWKPYQYGPDINPSYDVTAYLDKKVNGNFVEVGKIMPNGKASIHTHLEIDQYGNYAEPGEYYVRIVNNKTGANDRSNSSFTIKSQDDPLSNPNINSVSPKEIKLGEVTKITLYGSGFNDTLQVGVTGPGADTSVDDGSVKVSNYGTELSFDFPMSISKAGTYVISVYNYGVEAYDSIEVETTGGDEMALSLIRPTGGEDMTVGETYEINWYASPDIDKVSLGWSLGTGSLNWINGATNIPNTGSFNWDVNVGNFSGDSRQVKLVIIGYDTGVGSVKVESDDFFTVTK